MPRVIGATKLSPTLRIAPASGRVDRRASTASQSARSSPMGDGIPQSHSNVSCTRDMGCRANHERRAAATSRV